MVSGARPRIAIVGMACTLPGAHGAKALWQRLLEKHQPFGVLPKDRWDPEVYAQDLPLGSNHSYERGAIIEDVQVDWRTLRLPPLQVERMHRQEKVVLATMSEALADAGISPGDGPWEKAQVVVAASTLGPDPGTDHGRRIRRFELAAPVSDALAALLPGQQVEIDEIIEQLFDLAAPPIDPDSMTTSASLIAGRLANLYDFRGGHLAVDAGMASSLAAVDWAATTLSTGTSDLVLVCGVSPLLTPSAILNFAHRGYLTATYPRPLCEDADGTLLGEGCGAVVLVRLEDAVADVDRKKRRVYACIDGIGSAVVHPREGKRAQERCAADALSAALRQAGCAPGDIHFVETRACGLADDRAELRGLAQVLCVGRDLDHPLHVTSSVGNVGFLQAASGIVGLIKAAQALSQKTWPGQPTLPTSGQLPGGVRVPGEPVALYPLQRVGVSDTGIGPLAYHAILSAAPDKSRPMLIDEALRPPLKNRRQSDGVAIVGCGILVPQSNDVPTFWRNILDRVEAIGDLPRSRWDVDKLIGASKELGALLKTRLAGVVDLPPLDLSRFGVPPADAKVLDPAVSLALLASEQALGDARFAPGNWHPERVKVILGQLPLRAMEAEAEKRVLFANHLRLTAEAMREAGIGDTEVRQVIEHARTHFDRTSPALSSETLQAFSGLTAAAKVAAAYDFRGGALSVDAACGSSLAALHFGVESLLLGEADAVLCGGVAYNLLPEYYLSLSMLGFLAPRVEAPFSLKGNGFVPAEGAGIVVLRRLSDAVQGREPIYAVIRGVGCSSDGKGLSIFAPNTAGQQRAIHRALAAAEISADDLDLLEAHGAGTRLGDRTEMETYAAVFGQRDPGRPLNIGTLKSQIGHLSSAAGIASVIKVALALRDRLLPGGAGEGQPHPELPFGRLPLELASHSRAWIVPSRKKRWAGVSAFGLGGVNYHVVLQEHDDPLSGDRRAPTAAALHPAPLPARGTRADRFAVELCPLSLPVRPPLFSFRGRHVLLLLPAALGDPGLGKIMSQRLRDRGARVSQFSANAEAQVGALVAAARGREGDIDGVIDMSLCTPDPGLLDGSVAAFAEVMDWHTRLSFGVLREVYDRFSTAAAHSVCFVAVTAMGGSLGMLPSKNGNPLGAVLVGMVRGLKQELPAVVAKAIDFDPDALPERMTDEVLREVEDGNDRMDVAHAGRRFVLNLRRESFTDNSPIVRPIREGDVFLFSGGGRGVTFECACALSRLGVHVIVTGRTSPPDPSLPFLEMDDAAFLAYQKEQLVLCRAADPTLTPVRFGQKFAGRVRQRELHKNLIRARRFELPLSYELCDITDLSQVQALAKRVRDRHGHIDGVAHGAMVEWSRSLPGKTPDMIEKTLATKVVGVLNLLEACKNDPLRIFMCFGSGAGIFGNRGQIDYSAANALMAAMLVQKAARREHPMSHVTMDWTAWQEVGAAAANPDIAALVERTGVTSIKPAEGTYWFLSELCLGRGNETVIFEERMLHDWPFLGRTAEGTGERAIEFDDRGRPLLPGAWPLCDYLIESGPGRVLFERRIEVERDSFLSQHRLYGTPIVPATFGCEILAEAAALTSPGWQIEIMQDVVIGDPVKLHRDTPVLIRASARVIDETEDRRIVEAETHSHLFLRGRALQQDRLHHRGRFVLRRSGPREPRRIDLPEPTGTIHARSFFHLAKDPVYLGPLFCRAEQLHLFENGVGGMVRAPRQRDMIRDISYPQFQVDPLLLDASFQIAANWDGQKNLFVSIPLAVGKMILGRMRRRGEHAQVRAQVVRVADPDVFYDIMVTGDEGQVLVELQGVHLRRIGPLSEVR